MKRLMILLLIPSALLLGCDDSSNKASTRTSLYSLYSVEHDGHKFVVAYNAGLLHHPDCPCGKERR